MSSGNFDCKRILINSQFRDGGSSFNGADFIWRFQERIENVRCAELRQFVFENGVYNVDESNNTFIMSEGWIGDSNTPATDPNGWTMFGEKVTIASGLYDDTSLCNAIGSAMTGTSIVYGNANIYIAQLVSGIINITGSVDPADVELSKFAIGFVDAEGNSFANCGKLLGFTDVTNFNIYNTLNVLSIVTSAINTIRANVECKLASFDYLLIQSQKLGNDMSFYSTSIPNPDPSLALKGSASGCWASILNTPSANNSTILYENPRNAELTTIKYPYSLDYVDIRILDKYGRVVDIRKNNVTIVVDLFIDKKSQNISSTR